MAGLAKGMLESLPACGVRPACLRIAGPRNLGRRARFESPSATQPQPSRLPPLARGSEKVSVRRGKFSAFDVSGLGARPETRAGFAGRSPRPHGARSNDCEEPEPLRGGRLYGVAHENPGGKVRPAKEVSGENGRENFPSADLARGIAGGKRSALHGTRAPQRVGLFRDARFSPGPADGAVIAAVIRWPGRIAV